MLTGGQGRANSVSSHESKEAELGNACQSFRLDFTVVCVWSGSRTKGEGREGSTGKKRGKRKRKGKKKKKEKDTMGSGQSRVVDVSVGRG